MADDNLKSAEAQKDQSHLSLRRFIIDLFNKRGTMITAANDPNAQGTNISGQRIYLRLKRSVCNRQTTGYQLYAWY